MLPIPGTRERATTSANHRRSPAGVGDAGGRRALGRFGDGHDHPGHLDGAIESGERAAAEVMAALEFVKPAT
jgi:hypothetical protein